MSEFRMIFAPKIGDEEANGSFVGDVVGSYELANTMLETVANYTIYLHKTDLMYDWSNMGWIEQRVDGVWESFNE